MDGFNPFDPECFDEEDLRDPRDPPVPVGQRRYTIEQTERIIRRIKLRKRRAMARHNNDDSSGSDTDSVANKVKVLTTATPDGSTPKDGETKEDETKEDAKLVKLDPAEVGMSSGYKELYSGKEDKRGRFQWQTTIPEDVGTPAEDAESEKWAIIVRHVKVYNDPTKVLMIHSIVIQSPLLKELLTDVLAGYPGVTVALKRLEFNGRFEPLLHRWTELQAAIAKLKAEQKPAEVAEDTSQKVEPVDVSERASKKVEPANVTQRASKKVEHAELLQNLIVREFQETIDSFTDMKSQGVMTYEHLWTLFQPGGVVYSKQQGQESLFRLHSSKYGQDRQGNPVYWLTCVYVDYDGTRFGTNKLNVSIAAYDGTRPIATLPTFPMDFHPKKDELVAKLIERGEKIERYAGSHYRGYNGVGWRMNTMNVKEKFSIKGRIVIDTYGFNRHNPMSSVFVTALHVKDMHAASGTGGGDGGLREDFPGEHDFDGVYDDDEAGLPLDGFFADEEDEDAKRASLSDEQKMICTPLVRGYALKEKMWLNFFVNAVQEISFNTRAFDSLVLPTNQKELILGFTETQQSYRSQFDDVIEGKGRGIILLLCGPPGVGKTLTAESVAEEMEVPLYMMSAGDLGLDPRNVESKLQGILDMCTRWNAILLLDEADVFLEQRSLHELERNKLVSIFLRVLEYYEGIMFLTTNRVQTFDPAFQSRIHISLEYQELDTKSRKTVWQNFLKQHDIAQAAARELPAKALVSAAKAASTPPSADEAAEAEENAKKLHELRTLPHVITPAELNKLALLTMNGRQIKNILKTSQLLGSKRGEGLSYTHILTVMEVTQHLHKTTTESERAKASFFH